MLWKGAAAAAIIVSLLTGIEALAADRSATKDTQIANIGYLSPIEKEAIDFRRLQTEFMVAALSCGAHEYRSKYNDFVIRFRPALRRNGRTLNAIFKRTYGAHGRRQLDTYVTRLANEASVRSMENDRFCEIVGRKLDAVLRARRTETARGLLQQAQNP